MTVECINCQNPPKNRLIYETNFWRITLAPDQGYLGRGYIALKRHCGDLADLEPSEWLDFSDLVKKLESSLEKSFDAAMFNWTCLMNNAYQNDPPNPHVHWHFRPRYNHNVEFERLTFEDPEFGHHYDRARKQIVSEDILNKIVGKIRENL